MSALVLDTSVAVKWVSSDNEPSLSEALVLLHSIQEQKVVASMPSLSRYELGNVLVKGKQMNLLDALKALDALYQLPIRFIEENYELGKMTLSIAHEMSITYYDAAFIALAQYSGCVLLTENSRHQREYGDVQTLTLQEWLKLQPN